MAGLMAGLDRRLRSRRPMGLRVPDLLALDRRAIGRATARLRSMTAPRLATIASDELTATAAISSLVSRAT